jgi:hypothetical protein
VRIGVIAALFAVLGTQLWLAWPDPVAMGLAFVIILTVTTSVGIALGIFIHPRIWCHVCPMGTIAGYLSRTNTRFRSTPAAAPARCARRSADGDRPAYRQGKRHVPRHGLRQVRQLRRRVPVKALSFPDGKSLPAARRQPEKGDCRPVRFKTRIITTNTD